MDRLVKARYYQVTPIEAGDPDLRACLDELWGAPNREAYTGLHGNIKIRLERFRHDTSTSEGFFAGEFVRQQTENIPPIAYPAAPLLGNPDPLGHRCAFRYHVETCMLMLEIRREAVSFSRINQFVRAKMPTHKGFLMCPALTSNALERLMSGTPRKLELRVARPNELAVEDERLGIEGNLAALQSLYDAPMVEIAMGWSRGDRTGMINRSAMRRTIDWAMRNRGQVEKLKVKILEETEAIDLLAEQMMDQEKLDLSSDDVDQNYAKRDRFLLTRFSGRLDEIRRLYARRE